jgi:hypothetical protein
MPFICSICEEASTQICARCTKDTCGNHLCEKCQRCSDCCECEVALEEKLPPPVVRSMTPISGDSDVLAAEAAEPELPSAEPAEPAQTPEPDSGATIP